ncbi:MAG TPA: YciI family protein [Xanthomonadaceae bacterium]|nr:YciI family protein [Xanthomonadaceae bacterium]
MLMMICLSLFAHQALTQSSGMPEGMKKYVVVLLWRGERAGDHDAEALAEIQRGHMATINRLAQEKKLVIAGPFADGGDLRGIFVLDVDSVEEAEALVANDPAVQAGRLRVELKPWWSTDRLPELLEPRAEQ